jgi:hypothetical protein
MLVKPGRSLARAKSVHISMASDNNGGEVPQEEYFPSGFFTTKVAKAPLKSSFDDEGDNPDDFDFSSEEFRKDKSRPYSPKHDVRRQETPLERSFHASLNDTSPVLAF